jgi:hypothetical protein
VINKLSIASWHCCLPLIIPSHKPSSSEDAIKISLVYFALNLQKNKVSIFFFFGGRNYKNLKQLQKLETCGLPFEKEKKLTLLNPVDLKKKRLKYTLHKTAIAALLKIVIS